MSRSSVASTTARGEEFERFWRSTRDEPTWVILGVQGSGTNLLRSLLTQAFNFSVVQDQTVVFNAARRLGPRPTPAAVEAAFHRLVPRMLPDAFSRKTRRLIKTNGSFEGIRAAFAVAKVTTGPELAQFVYAYSAFSRNTRHMAIKSDDLWQTIADIEQVLPNRRVILLTRDFRDNLLSITKKDFGPVNPVRAALYVKRRFSAYHDTYQRTPDEHRFHVRYEDLLSEPEAFVSAFGRHFGLEPLRAGQAGESVNSSRIRRDNSRKWGRLSARELAQCEAILGAELRAHGYGVESSDGALPSTIERGMALAHDLLARIPQKLSRVRTRLQK